MLRRRRKVMKRLILFPAFALLILTGCGYNYKQNIRPDEITGGKLDLSNAYIYGTYEYAIRSPLVYYQDEALAIDIAARPSDGKNLVITLIEDKGFFFTALTPGDYTIKKIMLIINGQEYDEVNVNQDFTLAPGVITYLGSFSTEFIRNSEPFIWWGVKSVDDRFTGDQSRFNLVYSGVNTASLVNGYSTFGSTIKPFQKRDTFDFGGKTPGMVVTH